MYSSCTKKGKGSPYSITDRRVPELTPVLGSQPAGDVSHKPGGRLPLPSAKPAVTPAALKRAATSFAAWRTEARSLPKTVTRQRRDCDLNPGRSAPESSTLTTRLPSHPHVHKNSNNNEQVHWQVNPSVLATYDIGPLSSGADLGGDYTVTSHPHPPGAAAYFMLLLCV